MMINAWTDLDDFVTAYLECALWSSVDDAGNPMDDTYGVEDIAQDSLNAADRECRDFRDAQSDDLAVAGLEDSQAGHDFWLTRNGHGAGFWDRGLGDVGDRLTEACKPYGSCDVYIGDDGHVYLT